MQIYIGASFTLEGLTLPDDAKPLTLLWVEPGAFRMGDPGMYADGGVPFEVVHTKGFWLGQYLVTQAQWKAVMQTNPSHFQAHGTNRPIENVSWNEAMAFCACLNQEWEHALPIGYRFSLPTEAQWEYACRAGTHVQCSNGHTPAELDQIAWYQANSGGQTHPVGEKSPNKWLFYDMVGNVFELCFDQARSGADMYPTGVAIDWIGASDSVYHIFRSSTYNSPPSSSLVSCSGSYDPGVVRCDERRPWLGFRLSLRK